MQARIDFFQGVWNSISGHVLEKVQKLLQKYSSEDQAENEALHIVLAYRLMISITAVKFQWEKGFSSLKTIDEIFNLIWNDLNFVNNNSSHFANNLFNSVVYYFSYFENINHNVKFCFPIIEKIFICLKNLNKTKPHYLTLDASLALIDYYRRFACDEQLKNNGIVKMVFDFLTQSCEINYGRVIRILVDDLNLKYIYGIQHILNNVENINIQDSDPKSGDTALHILVAHWRYNMLYGNKNNTINNLLPDFSELVALFVRYDISCLSTKNNRGFTPAGAYPAMQSLLASIEKQQREIQRLETDKRMKNAMLLFTANRKDKNSPINGIPDELAKKISSIILEDNKNSLLPEAKKLTL